MPAISSSSLARKPIVLSIAVPMMNARVNE